GCHACSGLALGFQAGYNWQVSQLVLGIEADATLTPWSKTVGSTSGDTNLSRSMEALASVRGRLGVAIDRTLIYATGGVAYGQGNSTLASSRSEGRRVGKE